MDVEITTRNNTKGEPRVWLSAPYHPDCSPRARGIGGRWSATSKLWSFDPRDEERVRELARDLWGTDGSAPADTVTVRVEFIKSVIAARKGIYIAGRSVAYATGRDSGARLGGGVIHVSGPKPNSGGSVKNWDTVIQAGTVLEVRDLPRAAVEHTIAEAPAEYTLTILEDVPTKAELSENLGTPVSKVDTILAQIRALSPAEQAEVRNALQEA